MQEENTKQDNGEAHANHEHHDNHDHNHAEGKIAINRIEVSDVDPAAEEIIFFNNRIAKIENLEVAKNCRVSL